MVISPHSFNRTQQTLNTVCAYQPCTAIVVVMSVGVDNLQELKRAAMYTQSDCHRFC